MELPHFVDVLALDREQQSCRAQSRTVAVGADVLDHHLVEPLLHPRIGFPALAIAPVPPLYPSGDAVEADLLALVIIAFDLRFRR